MAIIPHEGIKGIQELLEKLGNSQTGSSNHEMLQGLLGGDANGHYHMTQEQFNLLPTLSSNHEQLQGLLGGDASGHYHLKFSELTKLMNYPDYEELNHERLKGLLGGSSEGHYHLTVDLLNKLISLPSGGTQSGQDGQAATIQIGSVTTGAAGSSASVTNSGTSTNAIFNFVIPRGDKGDKGDKGDGGTGSSTDIVDNLTSTRTDAALSANMGRELNDKIKNYYTESWTFTLEDGSTVNKTVVLSS